MRVLTIRNAVVGGIGAIILGFLYQFGSKLFDVVSNTSPTQAESLSLDSITIGLVGPGIIVVIVGILYLRKERDIPSSSDKISQNITHDKELVQQKGLSVFTRAEIEPYFEKFLREAKSEIVIIAASMVVTITGKEDNFQRVIEQNRVKMKFLLLNPESKLVQRLENDLDWKGMKGQINTAISALDGLKSRLDVDLKENLQVILYDRIPTVSMVILDPSSQKPTIQVANYANGTDIGSRFVIQIRGMDRTEAVPQKYLAEYQRVLKSQGIYEEKDTFGRLPDSASTVVRH